MAIYREVRQLSSTNAAYIAGLIDGEGTITLSRRHANEHRQLVISISNTERSLLNFVLEVAGAGKITTKRTSKEHHSPGFAYAISNRQGLSLLSQVAPYLRSYKRLRACLVLDHYVRLTPRNGKYTRDLAEHRQRFEAEVLALHATD